MQINWKQSSTKRGLIGLFIAIVGGILLLKGAKEEMIVSLLLLAKGISDILKVTQSD